jgi:hypothetical protein
MASNHPNAPIPFPVSPRSHSPSSGQIDTVISVVKEWTQNEQTGKVTLNFHQGRLNTVVKEETVRLNK